MQIPPVLTNAISQFSTLDADNNGIDRTEAAKLSGLVDQFDRFDQDRNGMLTLPELQSDVAILQSGNSLLTPTELAGLNKSQQDIYIMMAQLMLKKIQDKVSEIKESLNDDS